MKNELSKYALVDLHLHLDGALSPEAIIKIAQKEGTKLPTYDPKELKQYLAVPKNCESLNEYLKRFDIPNLVLQTEYGLKTATLDLLERLSKQGLIYAEIRMAPQLSTSKGLSQQKVVETLTKTLKEAEKLYKIKSNLILCLMRGKNNKEANLETIKVGQKFLNNGVCALDLAGAEAIFPNELFEEEFNLIKSLKIPYTIHAGEAAGSDSVISALKMGAQRIGHGVHSVEDDEVVEYLADHKIPLELCPTSNLDTKAVEKLEDFPIKHFIEKGVIVTINTDDPTVSDTSLPEEFALLKKLGLNEEDAKQIAINSINSAFISKENKLELIKRIK